MLVEGVDPAQDRVLKSTENRQCVRLLLPECPFGTDHQGLDFQSIERYAMCFHIELPIELTVEIRAVISSEVPL